MSSNLSMATLSRTSNIKFAGMNAPNNLIAGPMDNEPYSCDTCYDFREPSYQTVQYGDGSIKGFLPAGAYNFLQNGAVVSSCTGELIPTPSLYARTNGPIIGATIGSCSARASQSSILNKAGAFNPLPSTLARKCFL